MKKILLMLSLAVNAVFLLLACAKENAAEATGKNQGAGNAQKALQLNPVNTITSGTTCTSCTGTYPGMSYTLVKTMINNYRTKQLPAIQNALGIQDARACWFELTKVKDFICHLETLVQQSGCTNLGVLGLRFYYGAHTTTPSSYGSPSNYARLHNLVIIPTYRNGAGANVDFDPAKITPGTCVPLPLNRMARNEKMDNVLIDNAAFTSIFAMNHGQLGPPDSAGISF